MFKLPHLLKQMYEDGLQRDKVPQKRKLHHGLHISLTCHSSGVTLILSRDKVYPSAQEWKACLAAFPYFAGDVPFAQIIDSDRRFAIKGEIPNRREIAEQLKFA